MGSTMGYGVANTTDTVFFPTVVDEDFKKGHVLPFSAHAGDVVLFSGQHLHRTNIHSVGHTRFSVEFRVVNLADDENKLGPRNVDNASCK